MRARVARRRAQRIIDGYNSTPGPERVLLGLSTSFAITIATSRTINYVRERRRALPRIRGLTRL
ncbi:hypothetical protein GBW32_35360 [Streptomyces tsukubensis]|uniref:hypothetical protein n=1 Tax=Streptomyces tsukubensis TaxID=83656 RepID=UPI00126603E4|nr:hypothetical protein [Streptomyces tsukubensis]QFR97389.1 hypothetical protein GBW32_35360 [Streptomyces tsukubensis]